MNLEVPSIPDINQTDRSLQINEDVKGKHRGAEQNKKKKRDKKKYSHHSNRRVSEDLHSWKEFRPRPMYHPEDLLLSLQIRFSTEVLQQDPNASFLDP